MAVSQGLLDLEGSSLTPILVSLVKKDASMLDAFGKGASVDIRRAKAALYYQITRDPDNPGLPVPEQKPGVEEKPEGQADVAGDLHEPGDKDALGCVPESQTMTEEAKLLADAPKVGPVCFRPPPVALNAGYPSLHEGAEGAFPPGS